MKLDNCILKYINEHHEGGLIPISLLASYCLSSKIDIFIAAKNLEKESKVELVKRFFCPNGHLVLDQNFCPDCELKYLNDYISTHIYIKPINIRK